MSGYAPDGTPQTQGRDPFLRFLAGCALVVGAVAALAVIVLGLGGWFLVRDATPAGRTVEPFPLPGDTAYWSLDLRPDDPGLREALAQVAETADRLRRESAPRSPLANLPVPPREADLGTIFPMAVEVAAGPRGWAARFTMSKHVLRLRAALRVTRWVMTRDARQAGSEEVDGITVTTLRPHGTPVAAFAMVGRRLLVAERPERLRAILSPELRGAGPSSPSEADHGRVRREGEIGWGFRERIEIPETDPPQTVGRAAASFVLTPSGTLDVAGFADGCPRCNLGAMGAAAARIVVARLVPGIDPLAVVLADGSPRRTGPQGWRIEATVPDTAKQLEVAFARFAAREGPELSGGVTAPPGPEPPPAIPPPPSPGMRSGRRSGTPAAPPRAGSPTPAR